MSNNTTEMERLAADLAEARSRLGGEEYARRLAGLRAAWAAEDERKLREKEAAAAEALSAARQKVRDSIAALRAIDPNYVNVTQQVLRDGAA